MVSGAGLSLCTASSFDVLCVKKDTADLRQILRL